jgi:glucan phosphoethanolaminetransferase (alkaline phosphatase superfamily)
MTPKVRNQILALAAICLAPIVTMLAWGWGKSKPVGILSFFLTCALGWVLLVVCTRRWRWLFLAYFPLLLMSIAYLAYTLGFGIVPGHTLAILWVSASAEELMGLWGVWQDKWLALPVLALLGAYLWLAWRLPDLPIFVGRTRLATRVLLGLSVPAAAFAAHNVRQLFDGLTLNPVTGSVMFGAGLVPRARAELHGAGIQKIPYHAHREDRGEEVHVFIVGESARRDSWSVYGYQRPTTPYLEKLKSEAFFLQHAVADANLTSLSVPMILTGMTPEEHAVSGRPHGTLLDLAKEAGYSTSWLVNQDLEVSTSIGVVADHLEFPPETNRGSVFARFTTDEALLPAYKRELENGGHPRFIGLHVLQSHWEYYKRYPPKFQRYGDVSKLALFSLFDTNREVERALTDSYDNSVLYSDWFLEQVIEAARQLKVPATVTFVPDHGESLPALDNQVAGHGGPDFYPSQYEIPAFVWVNDAYRAAHPQRVATLKANVARQVRSHEFFYTVADLMGISWPDAKPERSFVSPSFVPDTGQYLVGGVLKAIPETSVNTAAAP